MSSSRPVPSVADRFVALVGVLNRECELLDHLVFKLHEAELLTAAGETRFLMFMADEIDGVAGDLGAVEVARAVLVADLTDALDLDDDASLLELADHADANTAGPLLDARSRLLNLMEELDEASGGATEVVGDRLDEVTAALSRVEQGLAGASAYDGFGSGASTAVAPAQFDEKG